jgi:filamentous hemagglutinin family protein
MTFWRWLIALGTSLAVVLTAGAGLVAALSAQAPAGDFSIISGDVTQTEAGSTVTLTQTTPVAIIGYTDLQINAGTTVHIEQPSPESRLLIRVVSSSATVIAGNIVATGQVAMVNPEGIAVSPGAQVDASGLVLSALDVTDRQFVAAHEAFQAASLGDELEFFTGYAGGAVSNAGELRVAAGGLLALLAPGPVSNSGTIRADAGIVDLFADSAAVVWFRGLGQGAVADTGSGGPPSATVTNSGVVTAVDGFVQLFGNLSDVPSPGVVDSEGVVLGMGDVSATGWPFTSIYVRCQVLQRGRHGGDLRATVRIDGQIRPDGEPVVTVDGVSYGPVVTSRTTADGRRQLLVVSALQALDTAGPANSFGTVTCSAASASSATADADAQ